MEIYEIIGASLMLIGGLVVASLGILDFKKKPNQKL